MNKIRSTLFLTVTGVALLGAGSAQAATLRTTIDSFGFANPDPTVIALTGNSSPRVTNGNASTHILVANAPLNIAQSPNIIGGERELQFTRIFANARTRSGNVTIDPSLGTLSVDNGTGFNSSTTVLWNGIGNAGLNADLSNRDFFELGVLAIDLDVTLALTVMDNDSMATVSRNNIATGVATLPFSEFTGIDFSQVKSIQLVITGPVAFDTEIDILDAVAERSVGTPEPSTSTSLLALLGVTFLGALTGKKKNSEF